MRARREAGKWLAGREYDLGIGALPVDHPRIRTERILRVQAKAIVPHSNPLSRQSRISGDELKGQPIIRLMHGLLLRNQLDDIFRSAGVIPNEVWEVASSQMACALMAEGVGITIADELVASHIPPGSFALVPIEPERWMSFGLLIPKASEPSASRQALMEILKDRARALGLTSDGIQFH